MGAIGQICMENTVNISVCLATGCAKGVRRKMVRKGTLTVDTEHIVYLTKNCDYFMEGTGSLNDFF